MRLDSNDDFELDIKGPGVFSEDPAVHDVPDRPLVRDMPELAVVQNIPELPDELDIARGRALIISIVPGAPAPAHSGFGRDPENLYDN